MKFSSADGSLYAEIRAVREKGEVHFEVEKHSRSCGFEKWSAHGDTRSAVKSAYEWVIPERERNR